jgi:hypothetical protein
VTQKGKEINCRFLFLSKKEDHDLYCLQTSTIKYLSHTKLGRRKGFPSNPYSLDIGGFLLIYIDSFSLEKIQSFMCNPHWLCSNEHIFELFDKFVLHLEKWNGALCFHNTEYQNWTGSLSRLTLPLGGNPFKNITVGHNEHQIGGHIKSLCLHVIGELVRNIIRDDFCPVKYFFHSNGKV